MSDGIKWDISDDDEDDVEIFVRKKVSLLSSQCFVRCNHFNARIIDEIPTQICNFEGMEILVMDYYHDDWGECPAGKWKKVVAGDFVNNYWKKRFIQKGTYNGKS